MTLRLVILRASPRVEKDLFDPGRQNGSRQARTVTILFFERRQEEFIRR